MTHLTKRTIALFFTLVFLLVITPILASAASLFKDINTNHSAYSAIEWAYKEGLTKGYADGTFGPDRTVTEAQFVAMLIRLDCSAADSSKASTASNYRYLQNKNIPVNGSTNVRTRNLPITKGQVARIAAAFQGVDLSETQAVQYMYKNDLANGAIGKNDYKSYGADLSMTRADTVVFLQRLSEKGSCEMIGLNGRPTGSDDKTITLPPAFLGTGSSVTFNPPTVTTQPPVVTQPSANTGINVGVDIDIDKPKLIANGVDSTFVTVSLKSCTNGGTIDYTDSLSFTVRSALGAIIDNNAQTVIEPKYDLGEAVVRVDVAMTTWAAARNNVDIASTELKNRESMLGKPYGGMIIVTEQDVLNAREYFVETKRSANIAERQVVAARTYLAEAQAEANNWPGGTNAVSMTDGPDMIVKITAPRSTQYRTDTLTFQLNQSNINCANQPIAVNLDYAPQAELRLEIIPSDDAAFNGALPADGTTAELRATVVSPGGQTITDYNGRVRFRSAQGTTLANEYMWFTKGVATTNITSLNTTYSIADEITAELEVVDPFYRDVLSSLVSTTQRLHVRYEPTLQADTSCTFTVPEIAFIIDSSGSMKRSDPDRARETKSQDLMLALNVPKNIATKFNSNGTLLHPVDTATPVASTLINVGQSGGTNIANGLRTAFNKFEPGNAPKIAILLTDGKSNAKQTLDEVAKAIPKNIKIYTIGLGDQKQLNEALLRQIATDTGGHYYHVAESSELGAAYQSILSAITCDIPPGPSCTLSSQIFTSPTLETIGNDFFMNTYVNDNCGQITRVVLRFYSSEGNIDYELANRNRAQGYFALQKGAHETNNFHLLQEGVFLAYNANGDLVGEKRVQMTRRY